jgi:malate dehydrogenase (oxaloacetate-decarboxylating)(NADP+)
LVDSQKVLDYHSGRGYNNKAGKIATEIIKPCSTAEELSLAYTPGVALPCLEIQKNSELANIYTNKANLVAVVSNGTAVLGLGNIGALSGKPVMEGKIVLFKKFADVDGYDIEINSLDSDKIIEAVKLISPTFGGINLEDIRAPECFYIEETLKKELDIPVFHDDQHGTAIISGAGLLNALEITGKKIGDIKVVFSGAGAAGIACAKFYRDLGVKMKNIIITDSKGVVYKGRTEGMNKYKEMFAAETELRTLKDAMKGADVFLGVSAKDLVSPEMLQSMNDSPVVFAMANPDPEITYDRAKAARDDVIIATGRSDYPNQINNVLGFPFIFRGALDTRASNINEDMKKAASYALAKVAKMPVTEDVVKSYGGKHFEFGRDYIVPKPFDGRVAVEESFAVAEAAVKSGVARKKDFSLSEYRKHLEQKFLKTG